MTQKVVRIPSLGEVILIRHPRSRRLKLRVRSDRKTVVTFPLYVSYREAARFAGEHIDWIIKQQQKLETSLPKYSEDIGLKTRFHKISFCRSGDKLVARKNEGEVVISVPACCSFSDHDTQLFITGVVTAIYRLEAKSFLPARLAALAAQRGFRYGKVTIRNNKTNWGSCSGRNNISLNLHLMKLPDHLIDYVLLHELVHTKIKNHGPGFWELLNVCTEGKARPLASEIRKHKVYPV